MNVDSNGRYVIEGYDTRPPFASFLPGIAGPLGIPMWAFYVNRGQAIASLGVGSKDNSIIEFQPAVRAYTTVSTYGFRTWVKLNDGAYCEPFARVRPQERTCTEMAIGLNDLEITDTRADIGLRFDVLYFLLPSSPYGGLVRRLVVTNISGRRLAGELMDGLPHIIPSGISTGLFKAMANTMGAWMRVTHVEAGIPFYGVEASVEDRPEVAQVTAGHVYSCMARTASGTTRLRPIVDPQIVFGANSALTYPDRFLEGRLDDLLAVRQVTTGRAPCGLFGTPFDLEPGGELAVYGLVGHVGEVALVDTVAELDPRTIDTRHVEARALADAVTRPMVTRTSSPAFDGYCRQTFLDNVLRGGAPLAFDGPQRTHIFHIYGRRHGDLERDYNFFAITPEYLSQGNAAYRDVNQNRRCDVLFEPRVEDGTVARFMNLIQIDGYNPLELLPCALVLDGDGRAAVLQYVADDGSVAEVLAAPFTPGRVLRHIEARGLQLACAPMDFVEALFRHARMEHPAAFGEGYWVDHWTYNLDLIDAYLAVYPDQRTAFFFERRDYTFFDSPAVVQPRSARYVEADGAPRQFGSVLEDAAKAALIASRTAAPNVMRAAHGHGAPYRTHLFGKLLALAAVKFSTLDPGGMGLEMEAGKPGWYDALNGLPGLFGSSVSETCELKRLFALLSDLVADHAERSCSVPSEVMGLLNDLLTALERYPAESDSLSRWDHFSRAREAFRQRTRSGLSGDDVEVRLGDLVDMLAACRACIEAGLARARGFMDGLTPTYFRYTPTRWQARPASDGAEQVNEAGYRLIDIEGFEPHPLPLFLEGLVKQMKLSASVEEAAVLYERVQTTDVFDARLGLYKVNAPLAGESLHIGRARAYTPGWLENESVFLHMHYKYLLALLTAGLYEPFWQEARRGLIPFMDPAVYGRSILENASFLVSSAHPDDQLHGRGFVARLSGATAEFLSMWMVATAGARPFRVRAGRLTLELSPHLPGWLFCEDGTLSFTFLGHTRVIYHNPTRTDLLHDAHDRIRLITLEDAGGARGRIEGPIIPESWASRVREGRVPRIEVTFGEIASA